MNNPIPEFSRLLSQAYRASFALDTGVPNTAFTIDHRRAVEELVEFVREYDRQILENLEKCHD
jgi:hypothetical protein